MWAWWSLQNPGSEFRRNNRWCFIFQIKKRIEKLVQMKQTPAIAPPKLTPRLSFAPTFRLARNPNTFAY
jgi:hypothetical protein